MTPMEQRQRETDNQTGLFYRHESDRARFTDHSQVVIVPRLVTQQEKDGYARVGLPGPQPVITQPVRVSPALLGTKVERDAFADRMLADERRNAAATVVDEVFTEGHAKRNVRIQRHE